MTQSELVRLIALNGRCAYDEENKKEYKRLSRKFLRALAKELGLERLAADIRYNPGGIAVSGDSTLHSDHLYVTFNMDGLGLGVLLRTCKHRKDYTGGPNRWFSFERLKSTGVAGLAAFAQQVLDEGRRLEDAPMGRPPDEAQNVLDQIEDVITNRYEDGCKYTAIELRGILDAIVAILDTNRTADASEASASRSIQPDPEQRNARSRPIITAVIHSDDRMKSTEFPANRWFVAASDEEIRELASIGWGYDLEADRIAYYMEPLHLDVELVLDYCRKLKRVSKEPVGFEVSVDKDQAMAWLALHRPTLWQELKSLHG